MLSVLLQHGMPPDQTQPHHCRARTPSLLQRRCAHRSVSIGSYINTLALTAAHRSITIQFANTSCANKTLESVLSLPHAHTFSLYHSYTHSLSRYHTHTLSLSLCRSRALSLLSLYHARPIYHTVSDTYTQTHTHTSTHGGPVCTMPKVTRAGLTHAPEAQCFFFCPPGDGVDAPSAAPPPVLRAGAFSASTNTSKLSRGNTSVTIASLSRRFSIG